MLAQGPVIVAQEKHQCPLVGDLELRRQLVTKAVGMACQNVGDQGDDALHFPHRVLGLHEPPNPEQLLLLLLPVLAGGGAAFVFPQFLIDDLVLGRLPLQALAGVIRIRRL